MCSLPLIIRYREETVSNIRCGVTASIARFQFQIRADRGSIPRNGTLLFVFFLALRCRWLLDDGWMALVVFASWT